MSSESILPPPTSAAVYDKQKRGYLGKLGHGANADVLFLQTAISKSELDNITLIQHIPGSSQWPVRDLFQRDVDNERVLNNVLPYLQSESQVKFFNPLTLIVLPMEDGHEQIGRELPVAKTSTVSEGNHDYHILERESYFRFRRHSVDSAYSSVEWNSQKVHLVAIDGQHRLSAFKRWKNTPGASTDFADWLIPVVILGVFKADENEPAADLLDIVRATFVNINSRAEQVNEAREILLNDESVNAIATQEVVEHAHSNDCLPYEKRDLTRVPLIFFDWRGAVKNGYRVPSPGAIKSVEEIHDWFNYYILGDDGESEQASQLGLDDLIPPVASFGSEKRLSHEDSKRIRERIRQDMLPGFLKVLETFQPYATYIKTAREIEKAAYVEGPDLSKHAFDLIRFGSTTATPEILDGVHQREKELILEYEDARLQIDHLLRLDIGMRAVMCAYAYGKSVFDEALGRTSDWTEYADWFVKGVNGIYDEGWFQSYDEIDAKGRKILTQVVYNSAGAIINYKLEAQQRAFGALILILLFCKYGDHDKFESAAESVVEESWEQFSSDLETTIKRGYAQTFRSELRDFGTPAEIRTEAAKRAKSATEKHIGQLQAFLDE